MMRRANVDTFFDTKKTSNTFRYRLLLVIRILSRGSSRMIMIFSERALVYRKFLKP